MLLLLEHFSLLHSLLVAALEMFRFSGHVVTKMHKILTSHCQAATKNVEFIVGFAVITVNVSKSLYT